jgi:acyl carrier protein
LLAEFIACSSLTHCFLPTPVCESLFQEESICLPQELWLLTGGDKLSKVKPGVRLVNNYGPTEGTVVATSVLLEQEVISKGVIPIGRPISNTKVWIMDDSMNQVPVGVVGEICISGSGLARGYLNKEESTSQKFVSNPYGIEHPFIAGERMYKTGDLGKWQSDGNILFLGRKDDQVKIRGYRIELGEIEQVLGSQAGIEQAVVLVKEKEAGEKYLVAYYTSKQHREAQQLRRDLGKSLPQYMVPSYFMQLESFPLTPNGKIDRKALPAPETKKSQAAYVAPRTELEKQLVIIWKKVLGLEKVGITDDFFESGGHSLNITRMLYEINRVFDIKLQIKAVFASRTVQELAQVIEDEIIFKNGVAVNTAEQIINEKNSELWEI